jgi:hypothetical protein
MAKKTLYFPMKGKDTNFAPSQQPSFTTPVMLNVRPYDVLENRARGGQRPGMVPMLQQVLGQHYEDPTDIVALWHLDENSVASGGTVADQTSNFDLTEAASEAMESDVSPVGHALKFDGDSEYLESAAADGTNLDITGDQTIMFWFKPADVSGIRSIVSLADVTNSIIQYKVGIYSTNKMYATLTVSTAEKVAFASGVYVAQWNHFAAVFDGTAQTTTPYLNGVAGTPASWGGARDVASATDKVTVGARYDNSGATADQFFEGSLANVMIFNATKTQSEILTLMNNGLPVVDMCQIEFIEA